MTGYAAYHQPAANGLDPVGQTLEPASARISQAVAVVAAGQPDVSALEHQRQRQPIGRRV